MHEFYVEFGRRLRERRTSSGLSQAGLAQRVGLSRTSITNIEKGRQQVSLHLFLLLSAALGAEPFEMAPSAVNVSARSDVPEDVLESLAPEDQDWVLRIVARRDHEGDADHVTSGDESQVTT